MDFLLKKKGRGRPKVQRTKHDCGTPELQVRRKHHKKLAEKPAFYACPLIQLFTLGCIDEAQLRAGLLYRIQLFQAHNNMGIQLTSKSSLAAKLGCCGNDHDNSVAEKIYWQLSRKLWECGLRQAKAELDTCIINNSVPANTSQLKAALSKLSELHSQWNLY